MFQTETSSLGFTMTFPTLFPQVSTIHLALFPRGEKKAQSNYYHANPGLNVSFVIQGQEVF